MSNPELMDTILRNKIPTATAMENIYTHLPALLGATLIQSMASGADDILKEYLNTGGVARGRSSSGASEGPAVANVPDLGSAEKYPRPNGEDYFTRKWTDIDDVAVLRTS